MIDRQGMGLYDHGVVGLLRPLVVAIVLGGALLVGSPVQAHGFCQVVSVTVPSGGFAPTPLDVWAFATVPAAPTMSTVRQIVVCPSFLVTPIIVAPSVIVVDPPSTAAQRMGAPSQKASDPATAVSGVVPPVTVRDLAQNPARYDRQVLSLVGDATVLRLSADIHGALYTEIRLESAGASVAVLAWGTPKLHAGQRVRITGNFYTQPPFALAPGSPTGSVLEADVIEALP